MWHFTAPQHPDRKGFREKRNKRHGAAFMWLPEDRMRHSRAGVRLTTGDGMDTRPTSRRDGWSWWYLLFIVQFVAVLWPPFYNRIEPTLGGMPFFYWYQLLWVIIGAVLTVIVYFATEAEARGR
jgi:hypothetical protein